MSLGEAWSLWFNGQLDLERTLWGLELFWWGRIGKALQLLAGVAIVAEIVGADNLRGFGASLRRSVDVRHFMPALGHAWAFFNLMLQLVLARVLAKLDLEFREPDARDITKYKKLALLDLAIAISTAAALAFIYDVGVSDSILIFVLMSSVGGPLIIVMVSVGLAAILYLLDAFIMEGIARLLEKAALDRYVKLFTLAFLLIGFHFDFLTS